MLKIIFILLSIFSFKLWAQQSRYDLFPGDEVLAVSDVHGNFDDLILILQDRKYIDAELNWIKPKNREQTGKRFFVINGDLIHKGAQSRKVMDLAIRLEEQAGACGDHVISVLGNHDIHVFKGNLEFVQLTDWQDFYGVGKNLSPYVNPFWRALHDPDLKYKSWMLRRPTAVIIGDSLFVHAGPSPQFLIHSLQEINNLIWQWMGDALTGVETVSEVVKALLGKYGPFKTSIFSPVTRENLESVRSFLRSIFAKFNIVRIFRGHSFTDDKDMLKHALHGTAVVSLDAGMALAKGQISSVRLVAGGKLDRKIHRRQIQTSCSNLFP